MIRRRRCDHCNKLKHDLIEGCNYLGWPMKVCEECIKIQETTVSVMGWFGLIVIVGFFMWHLFLAAQAEQGRQFLLHVLGDSTAAELG